MQNPGIGTSATITGTISTKTPLTASSPTSFNVTTVSSEIVPANASRKGLIIVNLSSNTVYIGIGTTAVLDNGIALTGLGSTWNMSEYDFNTSAIYAVSVGTSPISIQEFV